MLTIKKCYVLERVTPTPRGAADPAHPPWRARKPGPLPGRTARVRLAPPQSSSFQSLSKDLPEGIAETVTGYVWGQFPG